MHFRFAFVCVACMLLVFQSYAQEPPRPELSKKEVRHFQKKLEKLNDAIKEKTASLQDLLNFKVDSTHHFSLLDTAGFELANTSEALQARISSKAQEVLPDWGDTDSIQNMMGLTAQIDRLKKELNVGMQLSRTNPKLADQLQDSFLELAGIEYNLAELNAFTARMGELQWDEEVLNKHLDPLKASFDDLQKQVGDYQSMMEEYKTQLIDWDKTLEDRISKLEAFQGLDQYGESLINPGAEITNADQKLEGFQSRTFVEEKIRGRFKKFLEEEGEHAIAKRLAEGHTRLEEYKQKAVDLKDITKPPSKQPNPLKEKSLGQRLKVGGNLQLNRSEPFTVDTGLELAYLLNPKTEWGLGAAYRVRLEKLSVADVATEVLNLKSFYHYKVFKRFGFQANYELNHLLPQQVSAQPVEIPSKKWVQSGLMGIRFDQPLSRLLNGYMTMQYDFLHKPESPNTKWVFRFGLRLQ